MILEILILLLDFSYFDVELLQHGFSYIIFIIILHWYVFSIFSDKYLVVLRIKNVNRVNSTRAHARRQTQYTVRQNPETKEDRPNIL